jgi:hypothetical protein
MTPTRPGRPGRAGGDLRGDHQGIHGQPRHRHSPRPSWQNARGVMILSQFKAGFIFGVKGGYGVLMVKKPSGRWSLPVLIDASEASLGLQLGAKSVDTVCILTDDATPRLLFANRFNIGVDAKAVAGPSSAESRATRRDLHRAGARLFEIGRASTRARRSRPGTSSATTSPTSPSTTRPTRCRSSSTATG